MVDSPPHSPRNVDQADIGSPDIRAAQLVVTGLEARVAELGSAADSSYDHVARAALDTRLNDALAHLRSVREVVDTAAAINGTPPPPICPDYRQTGLHIGPS